MIHLRETVIHPCLLQRILAMLVGNVRSYQHCIPGMIPVGTPNSFEPRPNPLMTGPLRKTGNGGSGFSGPTINGRSVGGDMEKVENENHRNK